MCHVRYNVLANLFSWQRDVWHTIAAGGSKIVDNCRRGTAGLVFGVLLDGLGFVADEIKSAS